MQKQKSSKKVISKVLRLLPVIILMVLVVSCTTSKEVITATKIVKSTETNANSKTLKDKEDNFHFLEDGRAAKYPGGTKALLAFLSKNIKYPAIAQKNKTAGRVLVQFIINKEGHVRCPKVVKSVSTELDREAIRVIRLMSNWKPAFQRGHTINMKYTVPVIFHI